MQAALALRRRAKCAKWTRRPRTCFKWKTKGAATKLVPSAPQGGVESPGTAKRPYEGAFLTKPGLASWRFPKPPWGCSRTMTLSKNLAGSLLILG